MKDADVIYAKSWGGPLLTTADPAKGKELQDSYKDWIMDQRRLELGKSDAIYMHPLPADRNIEVTDEVILGPPIRLFMMRPKTVCMRKSRHGFDHGISFEVYNNRQWWQVRHHCFKSG